MKKFEITKNTREISYKEREEIREGCTLEQADQEPEILKSFEKLEEAQEALQKYESEVVKLGGGAGTVYRVTEYYVQENEYDKDGDWISGGDVWEFSRMPEIED